MQKCKKKVSVVNSGILILTDILFIYNRIPTTYLRETTEYTKTENDSKINMNGLEWIVPFIIATVVVLLFIGVKLIFRRRRSKSCTIYLLFFKKRIS